MLPPLCSGALLIGKQPPPSYATLQPRDAMSLSQATEPLEDGLGLPAELALSLWALGNKYRACSLSLPPAPPGKSQDSFIWMFFRVRLASFLSCWPSALYLTEGVRGQDHSKNELF